MDDDDDIAIAATCLLWSCTSQVARSIRPCAERKKDSAPRRSAFISKIGINTVFIRPYYQIWQITIKRNVGTLCEWIWKCLRSCLNS